MSDRMQCDGDSPTRLVSYRDALSQAMRQMMTVNPKAVVFGQGVTDPTGIFGTTSGLDAEFGAERLIDTAIAEEGTTGVAVGAALNGLYPIVVFIRVDFMLLAMNQIINLAAKYRYMFGGRFQVPMLIRACVGRSWGQGPQHSQSLQSLFAHIPGLTVIMPSSAQTVLRDYVYAAGSFPSPVISIEHRLLYDRDFRLPEAQSAAGLPFSAQLVEQGGDVTIVATSYMVQDAQLAAKWLRENVGVHCDIIDLHNITSVDADMICESVGRTGRLLVADTSWPTYGVCAEVCRAIGTRDPGLLKQPVQEAALAPSPTPTSHALEKSFYPSIRTLIERALVLTGNDPEMRELPELDQLRETERKFRGPF